MVVQKAVSARDEFLRWYLEAFRRTVDWEDTDTARLYLAFMAGIEFAWSNP